MVHFVLILGLFLLAVSVTMVLRALTVPGGRSSETLEQIEAYGFGGTLPSSRDHADERSVREVFQGVVGALGAWLARSFTRIQLPDYRARLISAGMYRTAPERLLGIQFMAAVGGAFVWFALGTVGGMPWWLRILGAAGVVLLGWFVPTAYVDHTARKRREQIDKDLPDLIDLLVVTLEAGLSFPQSLRLASTKIKEPLAGEVRLTLQEQNMGIMLVEALQNFLGRIDTPGVRMFARSIAQGESLGVSTGQIMRNLAVELRKRRRAWAEERAQKAPIKILFPILFFIMPALFIVLLLPVMIILMDTL